MSGNMGDITNGIDKLKSSSGSGRVPRSTRTPQAPQSNATPKSNLSPVNNNAVPKSNGANSNKPSGPSSPNQSGARQNNANQNQAVSGSGSHDKSSLADNVKGLSSNATGVDYSDKNMKDQLKHQAADVAMDATPILGQVNSARKALKNFNKAKKDATGRDDDITDKVEEKADDVLEKGLDGIEKGAKMVGGMSALGAGTQVGMMGLLLMKGLGMLKAGFAMVMGFLAKIGGFLASVFGVASSFVSGLLGVGAVVANSIVAGLSAIVITASAIMGVGLVEEVTKKDDSFAGCVPSQTQVAPSSQDYVLEGDMNAILEDHAIKLWSVYSQIGGSKEQTAAVLGNLQAESRLDPTAIETIYDEPFQIGPRKQNAINLDFDVDRVAPSYGAKYSAIDRMGIGLAQWTNGRNQLLIDYASEQGVNWYEFDTQIRFMLEGDDNSRQEQLRNFLASETSNVEAETERFMNSWIGLSSPNASLSARKQNATNFMFTLERATVDTNYADSILSGLNVNRSQGNHSAGAFYVDDGCGNPIISHYGNQAADGTGEVPAGLELVPWSRETLPDSLKEFAKDPAQAGLAWGNATGWTSGVIPNQCAALAHSYFIQLYPAWNQNGRPTTRPFGDGKDVARLWAQHYGESTQSYPTGGALFSDPTTSQWGHTGIVQHVFANGDILIAEQNIRGVSGEGAGINYSWSWRVIKKDRYEQANWTFFKPANEEPQWVKSAN